MAGNSTFYDEACKEVQRHLEDSELSKLAHFEAAEYFDRCSKCLAVVNAVSVAIVLSWLLSSLLRRSLNFEVPALLDSILPILFSSIIAGVGAVTPALRFSEVAIAHRSAAQRYQSLWRNCRNFFTDFPDAALGKEASQVVRKYREQLNDINRDSPQIPGWAYRKAHEARDSGRTSYRVDERVAG